MGTRNVTIIRYNGKERVRQYGQWDGYPTAALASIVKFIKTDGAIEKLRQNVMKCKLVSEEKFKYPANFEDIAKELLKDHMNHLKYPTYEEKLGRSINYTKTEMFKYYLATRDTGYDIPWLLTTSAADKANEIILKKAYTDKCDWQIEAVNIIDLDVGMVTSYWHNKQANFGFNCLPTMDQLEKFEREG